MQAACPLTRISLGLNRAVRGEKLPTEKNVAGRGASHERGHAYCEAWIGQDREAAVIKK